MPTWWFRINNEEKYVKELKENEQKWLKITPGWELIKLLDKLTKEHFCELLTNGVKYIIVWCILDIIIIVTTVLFDMNMKKYEKQWRMSDP